MNWLIWKEYRLHHLIVVVEVSLLLTPYAVAAACLAWDWREILLRGPASGIWEILACVALFSLGISQLTIALLGGNAIAGERVDRSAEFLACLPLSRRRILAAKLLFTSAVLAGIWLPNLAALAISVLVGSPNPEGGALVLKNIGVTGLVFLGVGWLLSSMIESPTISIFVALAVPLIVLSAISGVGYFLGVRDDRHYAAFLSFWYELVSVAIALSSFGAGTVYYLRRVEP